MGCGRTLFIHVIRHVCLVSGLRLRYEFHIEKDGKKDKGWRSVEAERSGSGSLDR